MLRTAHRQTSTLFPYTTLFRSYTAVSVIERRAVYSREHGRETQYDVRHLERYLGEPYTAIITRSQGVLRKLKDPKVVVDGTGVGRPVIDLMRERGISPVVPVIITGGDSVTEEVVDGRREFRVPKRDLVGCLQVLLQNRQLRIPSSLDLRS